MQWILGYVRPWRVVVVHTPKTGKSRAHLWGAFGEHFELRHPSLWRYCTSNAHSKCADPELGHSLCLPPVVRSLLLSVSASFGVMSLVFQSPWCSCWSDVPPVSPCVPPVTCLSCFWILILGGSLICTVSFVGTLFAVLILCPFSPFLLACEASSLCL